MGKGYRIYKAVKKKQGSVISELREEIHSTFDENSQVEELAILANSETISNNELNGIVRNSLYAFLLFFFVATIISLFPGIWFVIFSHLYALNFISFGTVKIYNFGDKSISAMPTIVRGYFLLVYIVTSWFIIGDWFVGILSQNQVPFLSEQLTISDLLHFSVTTVSTLGYGDVVPVHWVAKILCSWGAVAGILYIAFSVAYMTSIVLDKNEFYRSTRTISQSIVTSSLDTLYDKNEATLSSGHMNKSMFSSAVEKELWDYIKNKADS